MQTKGGERLEVIVIGAGPAGLATSQQLAPRWLPPMREWYSGLISYPLLLPIQIVFIVTMARMTLDVWAGGVGWASPRPGLGAFLAWASFVYAGTMVVRFVVWHRRPPERRRAWIPIIFHVVLAAFLWTFASWHPAA